MKKIINLDSNTWFIILAIIVILTFSVLGTWFIKSHPGCLRYENTGTQTCHFSGDTTYCFPDRRCAEYAERVWFGDEG